MAAVGLSTIRSRLATATDAIAGFSISRNPFAHFGRSPQTVSHLRFAVGIMSTAAREDDRQREAQGIYSETVMGIRFAYRLPPKDQIAGYDGAFDAAQSVIASITNISPAVHANINLRYLRLSPSVSTAGEYMILTLEFEVLHFLPLI